MPCAGGIGPSKVGICSARDEGQVTISQMSRVSLSSICVRTPVGSLTPSLRIHEAQRAYAIDAVQRQCSIEDSVGEWVSLFEGSIVQIHLFEYLKNMK